MSAVRHPSPIFPRGAASRASTCVASQVSFIALLWLLDSPSWVAACSLVASTVGPCCRNGKREKFPDAPGVDGGNGTVLPVSPIPPPTSTPTPAAVPGGRRPSTVSPAAMTRPASAKSSGVKTSPRSSPSWESWEIDAVSAGADRVAVSASLTTDEFDDVALLTCSGVGIENEPILCYR